MRTGLEQLVTRFLAALQDERGASAHTLRAYRRELGDFVAFLAKELGADADIGGVGHLHIRAYLGVLFAKGLTKTSVARALAAVRSWFKWLAKEGVVQANPAVLVSTPKLPKHLPRVPSMEEMNRVLDGMERVSGSESQGVDGSVRQGVSEESVWPARDRVIFELLYGCGIRNGELVGLDVMSVIWGDDAIRIWGKGSKERIVPLGEIAAESLRLYLPERRGSAGSSGEGCVGGEGAAVVQCDDAWRVPVDDAECRTDCEGDCAGQGIGGGRASAHAAACVWNAHAGGGRGSAGHPGDAGAPAVVDDAAVYAADGGAGAAGV